MWRSKTTVYVTKKIWSRTAWGTLWKGTTAEGGCFWYYPVRLRAH